MRGGGIINIVANAKQMETASSLFPSLQTWRTELGENSDQMAFGFFSTENSLSSAQNENNLKKKRDHFRVV